MLIEEFNMPFPRKWESKNLAKAMDSRFPGNDNAAASEFYQHYQFSTTKKPLRKP
jgi:hypothetical protein